MFPELDKLSVADCATHKKNTTKQNKKRLNSILKQAKQDIFSAAIAGDIFK